MRYKNLSWFSKNKFMQWIYYILYKVFWQSEKLCLTCNKKMIGNYGRIKNLYYCLYCDKTIKIEMG